MKRLLRPFFKMLLLVLFSLSVFLCPPFSRAIARAEEWAKMTLSIKDAKLKVEIADSPLKRAAGLMYRDSLPEDAGMLFVFLAPEKVSFWMKDTKISLSIAFIDAGGVIKEIADMQPNDMTPVTSKNKVIYALEANLGWFKEHKIKAGDIIPGLGKKEE